MIFASQHTDNLLNDILNASQSGIVMLEVVQDFGPEIVDFRYVFINRTAREQSATLKNVEPGTSMQSLLTETDFQSIKSICQAVWLTGQPYRGERYFASSNEWFDAHFSRLDESHLVISFTNITEVKRSVLRHQQESELFQSVLASSSNPVAVCTPVIGDHGTLSDFRLALFNAATKDAWLFGPALYLGATLTELLPEPERSLLFSFCKQAFETGESQRFIYRYPNKDRWFSVGIQRFNQGVILNGTDVTEERQQQATLRQMNLDLQQTNENLQQFAYIASHDLQEPLRKIHSFGNLLQQQYALELGPQGADLIQRLQASSGRMTTLIQDLLTYSRLTTHREAYRPVRLGRLLNEIIEDIDPLLQDGQATADCGELPTIAGDATQLRQLFQNLLINAVTYRSPDRPAVIHITCQTLQADEVPSNLPTGREYVAISVSDNGIGFDERYTDRIFQMFQRLHGRSQYSGTGVGLAICKRVVENHQGFISATSTPGQGSTFRVILPL